MSTQYINHLFDLSPREISIAWKCRGTTELLAATKPEQFVVNDNEACFRALNKDYPLKTQDAVPPPDLVQLEEGKHALMRRNCLGARPWTVQMECVDKAGLVLQLRRELVPYNQWHGTDSSFVNGAQTLVPVWYVTRHCVVVSWYTPVPAEARCMFARMILEVG